MVMYYCIVFFYVFTLNVFLLKRNFRIDMYSNYMPKKIINVENNVNKNIKKQIDDDFTLSDESVISNFDKDVQDTENITKNDNDVEKKKAGRPKGAIKADFPVEKDLVLSKMNSILELSGDRNTIYVSDVDDVNSEKYKQIMICVPPIRKYFRTTKWTYFATGSDNILLLLKNFYTSCDYEVCRYQLKGIKYMQFRKK